MVLLPRPCVVSADSAFSGLPWPSLAFCQRCSGAVVPTTPSFEPYLGFFFSFFPQILVPVQSQYHPVRARPRSLPSTSATFTSVFRNATHCGLLVLVLCMSWNITSSVAAHAARCSRCSLQPSLGAAPERRVPVHASICTEYWPRCALDHGPYR